ncbi:MULTISPECIES: NADP-dependent oxidoreductase [Paenibacillus]|uniref:NADP-dependent oxidoreductase n=1 Tax=Paenibacillus sedimenti TaxID=2770274 RepID=A0A926KVN7_9BACL|nr:MULTISPECIES: NADP-dependent oxidoreductase [Paenibacillus]MBD0383736.1 NADP-dependent oxidoreductase [Paenibacillus sedimenti]
MRAMVIEKYGKYPLQLADIPKPAVDDHEVLVEIHAASVNPLDLLVRDGKLRVLLKYDMPHVLGYDFSGVVIQAGRKVTRFKVGDEVFGRPSKGGAFAEFISVNEDDIAIKPRNLTFEEASSIPLVGLTSYQVLHEKLKLKAGQKVLIQAGSGGVGTFAIQLAKAMGLYVATTTSEAGAKLVESLGADRIINYKTEQFDTLLQGYDAVFDTKGGETLEKAFKIVKEQGQIVSVVGPPNARFGKEERVGFVKTNLLRLVARKITKLEKKYKVKYSFLFMKPSGRQLEILSEWIESEKIKPVIDRVFPFEDTQKAMEYSESGRAKGKIVVKIK